MNRMIALVVMALAVSVGSFASVPRTRAATSNPVPNPSFENGGKFPNGWVLGNVVTDQPQVQVTYTSSVAHSGRRAMVGQSEWVCDSTGRPRSTQAFIDISSTKLIPVSPSRDYVLGAWGLSNDGHSVIDFYIRQYDATGNPLYGTDFAGPGSTPASSNTWTYGEWRVGPSYAQKWHPSTGFVRVGVDWAVGYFPVCSPGTVYRSTLAYDDISFGEAPASPTAYSLIWPFAPGKNWQITQGYNSTFSHKCPGYPYSQPLKGVNLANTDCLGLDIVAVDGSTAGTVMRAPVSGKVSYVTKDGEIMCIDTNDGRSVKVAHLTAALAKGTSVTIHDTVIGKLKAAPLSSGTGPHLHFGIYEGNGCLITGNSVATPRPFSGVNKIESGPEFPIPNPFGQRSGGYHKDTIVSSIVP